MRAHYDWRRRRRRRKKMAKKKKSKIKNLPDDFKVDDDFV